MLELKERSFDVLVASSSASVDADALSGTVHAVVSQTSSVLSSESELKVCWNKFLEQIS